MWLADLFSELGPLLSVVNVFYLASVESVN